MKNFKRIMACFLTVVMLFSALPTAAFAAQTEEQAEVDTGNVTIEGTNGFGTLLSEAITEEQESTAEEEEQYEGGYSVTDLVIEGSTATISYSSLEEATLVVALYSEDGMQMLTSATATVTADATEATVTFEGTMPEYFLASAYLLDTYDLSPLCAAYDTPMYTQEMQELLASTVEDYDEELVLNLDDDNTTNFAVYAETTKVIDYVEGVNTVASVDTENATYVIENADEQFTSLAEGDVFAYLYGEESMLIAKVAAITINGSTVTIAGDDDLELDDVFSHVKIENTNEGVEAVVDDSTADEGVTYVDDETETYGIQAYDSEGSVSNTNMFKISLDILDKGEDELNFQMEGNLEFAVKFTFEYYISSSYQRFKIDLEFETELEIEAKISSKWKKKISLGNWRLPVIPGLSVKFKPAFVFEASVSLKYTGTYAFSFGGYATHTKAGWDADGYYNSPDIDHNLELEGSLFIGFELAPAIEVLYSVDLQIKGKVGFKITGKPDLYIDEENGDMNHKCFACVSGDVSAELSTSIEMEFPFFKKLSCSLSLLKVSWSLFDWYQCIEHSGVLVYIGPCPDKLYRLTVEVVDEDNKPLVGAMVDVASQCLLTDESGLAYIYLPKACYTISATYGDTTKSKDVLLEEAEKVQIKLADAEGGRFGILGTVTGSELLDAGTVLASGTCGADGDNITWTLYSGGLLQLEGSGEMEEFIYNTSVPWYEYCANVKKVVVEEGITSISQYAFYNCSNLTSAVIPAGISVINEYTFSSCTSLTTIKLPDGIETIGASAFRGCTALETISIPEGATSIGDYAFYNCKSMTLVDIPDTVATMGIYVFANCSSLPAVVLPSGIAIIPSRAFSSCTALASVYLPDGITAIGSYAFNSCTNLKSINIPSAVTTVEKAAFSNCNNLDEVHITDIGRWCEITFGSAAANPINKKGKLYLNGELISEIQIPDGVSKIGDYVFYNCASLTSVVVPDSVTTVGNYAFYKCTALTSIHVPDTVNAIGSYAFYDCGLLTAIHIPDGVTELMGYSLYNCSSLTELVLPDGLTAIYANALYGCSGLTELVIPEGVTVFGRGAFCECTNLAAVNVPETVTAIEDYAFYGCSSLTELHIPDGITAIPTYTFYGCTGLETLSIPDSVTSFGKYAFYNCTSLSSVNIPVGVTTIPEYCFTLCKSLTEADLPAGITSIGTKAFQYCENLSSITIPEGAKTVGSAAFQACVSLREITLPDSVTSLGDSAFDTCTSLSAVALPEGVTSLPYAVFNCCSSLTSVDFPSGLTYVGKYAFKSTPLVSISLPDGLTTIDDAAFAYCSALISAYIPSSVTFVGTNAFYYCTAMEAIYYSGTELEWAAITIEGYNDGISRATIHYTSTGLPVSAAEEAEAARVLAAQNWPAAEIPAVEPEEALPIEIETESVEEEASTVDQVFGGEYNTEVTDTYPLKTASFTGLVPGEEYVLLALVSIKASDPLAAENLLYVDQAVALDDGTLSFQYVQREDTDISYVMACGASNKNLADATITFPEMTADGELQVVNPEVVYNGTTLTEGRDYTIVGTVDFTEAGTYTCYIRGIHNYTGLVECAYTVEAGEEATGTVTKKGNTLSLEGLIYINHYVLFDGFDASVDQAYIEANGGLLVWNSAITEEEAVYGHADADVNEGLIYSATGYMGRTDGIAIAEYADELYMRAYLKLSDGTYVYGPLDVYSVQSYCEGRLEKSSNEKLKNVCAALLHFGASAQVYFNYNVNDLANSNILESWPADEFDASLLTAVEEISSNIIASESVTTVGKSLSLESTILVNYYFRPSFTPATAELLFWEGVEGELTAENISYTAELVYTTSYSGCYHAQSRDIASTKYDTTIFCCAKFTDADGNTHYSEVIAYSPEAYAAGRIANSSNANLVAMVKQMVIYGEYAKLYFS